MRVEVPLYDLAGLKGDYNHITCLHLVIAHAAGFDDNQAFLAVYARYIAPREYDQTLFHKVKIGTEYLLFQFFQHITRELYKVWPAG